ncbi:MAG: hypothetical protein Q4D44_05115 [Eubacteriales bacterium]|nr:hypothetical protein [Eubacteriales bacterium]
MKHLIEFMCILIICVFLTGCTRVVVTTSDELTMGSWQHISKSGTVANLTFEGESATLEIKPATKDEAVVIRGIYSVDKDNLYITDESKFTTYKFGYDVYNDRVYISYKEDKIRFDRQN